MSAGRQPSNAALASRFAQLYEISAKLKPNAERAGREAHGADPRRRPVRASEPSASAAKRESDGRFHGTEILCVLSATVTLRLTAGR
jgi:hypothetical protein